MLYVDVYECGCHEWLCVWSNYMIEDTYLA